MDIRETYLVFPEWTQWFWTWLTGKALKGQEPFIIFSKITHLILTLVCYFSALLLCVYSISQRPLGWIAMVVICWVMMVASSRKLHLVISHYCIHLTFFKTKELNNLVADLTSIISITPNFKNSQRDHLKNHHNKNTFATINDPEALFFYKLGFRKDLPLSFLWKRFFCTLLSPMFHIKTIKNRLISSLFNSSVSIKIFYTIYVLLLFTLSRFFNLTLLDFFIVYVIPMIFIFQISMLLQLLSEHTWLDGRVPADLKSWGRFCGEIIPDTNSYRWYKKIWAWMIWSIRLIFYHFLVRICVLPGDLPQHDFHHLKPISNEWIFAAYARSRLIESRISSGRKGLIEVWGLKDAINRVFFHLSSHSPVDSLKK